MSDRESPTAEPDWSQRAVDAEEALREIRDAIENHELNGLAILDTIWLSPVETVIDRISAVLGDRA